MPSIGGKRPYQFSVDRNMINGIRAVFFRQQEVEPRYISCWRKSFEEVSVHQPSDLVTVVEQDVAHVLDEVKRVEIYIPGI